MAEQGVRWRDEQRSQEVDKGKAGRSCEQCSAGQGGPVAQKDARAGHPCRRSHLRCQHRMQARSPFTHASQG